MARSRGAPPRSAGGSVQERAAQERARRQTQEEQTQQATAAQEECQTVGTGDYIVKEGDCIASIAKAHGHFWETIWNDPGNAELKEIRQDPNILFPGDRVTIPELREKEEPGETEVRHRFRRRGEPGILRIVVKDMDEPRANQPYVLKVAGQELRGVTDADGKLEQPIPGSAKKATLIVGEGDDQTEYDLDLGSLDPIESIAGVQGRLDNLGYEVGSIDGKMGPKTIAAIEKFCGDHDITPPPPGQIDPTFREKLREVHGF